MRALVLDAGRLRLEPSHPEPKPRRGEALVQVRRAGICGTDVELLRGYKGFSGVPGHEFVGEVLGCALRPELVGRRVVGELNAGCGRCSRCRRGGERHCRQRRVLGISGMDGAFAERVALPARNLHVADAIASDDAAVFVEPFAAVLRIFDQTKVTKATRVVVLGRGRLGRLAAAILQRKSDHVTLAGRDDPAPRDADLVLDATGSPDGFARALDAVRPLGTIVLKSTCAGDAAIPASLLTKAVVDEVTIVGSRCGTHEAFDAAIAQIALGRPKLAPFVEATYALADFERAFEHAARPGAGKVLLDPA